MSRFDPQMNGGMQLDLFAAGPATAAGPAADAADETVLGPTTVVCIRGRQKDPILDDPRFLYVGRPMFMGGWRLYGHPLSNPFPLSKFKANEAVERYQAWLLRRPHLAEELRALRGRILGCWCAEGQPCHARVLAALADRGVSA